MPRNTLKQRNRNMSIVCTSLCHRCHLFLIETTFTFVIGPHQSLKPQTFRNPYDIPRSHLLDQLSRMRRNLLNTSVCNLRGQDSGKEQRVLRLTIRVLHAASLPHLEVQSRRPLNRRTAHGPVHILNRIHENSSMGYQTKCYCAVNIYFLLLFYDNFLSFYP